METSRPTLNTKRSTFTPEKYRRFFERPFINQAAGEFLFEERHLHPKVVQWCRLTSWKNWLQIPYYDIEGHLTGVQWRNLACLEGTTAKRSVTGGEALGKEPKGESGWKPVPRFKFPYGSKCHINNLPVLKLLKPGEDLWIAEGCSDCWSLLSSGHKAIAIPSATLLKPKDLEILSTLNTQHSTLNTQPPHVSRCRHPRRETLPPVEADLGETLNTQHSTLTRHSLPSNCKDYSDYYLSTLNSQH